MSTILNRDKLGKVLALLASPVDGEALAAARMVVKILKAADMRPEALATGLPTPPPAIEAPPTARKPAKLPTVRDLGIFELRKLIAEMRAAKPKPDDRAFLAAVSEHLKTATNKNLNRSQVTRLNKLWHAALTNTGRN